MSPALKGSTPRKTDFILHGYALSTALLAAISVWTFMYLWRTPDFDQVCCYGPIIWPPLALSFNLAVGFSVLAIFGFPPSAALSWLRGGPKYLWMISGVLLAIALVPLMIIWDSFQFLH